MGWVLKWADIKHRVLMLIGISVAIIGILFIFDLLPFQQDMDVHWDGVLIDRSSGEVIAEATLYLDGKMDRNFLRTERFHGDVTVDAPEADYRMMLSAVMDHERSVEAWVLNGGCVVDGQPHVIMSYTDKMMERIWLLSGDESFDGLEFVSHAATAEEAAQIKAELLQSAK